MLTRGGVLRAILFGVVLAAAPFFVGQHWVMNALVFTAMYAALASAWNLVGGYAGYPSLGHAAFFGIGAYAMAWRFPSCHRGCGGRGRIAGRSNRDAHASERLRDRDDHLAVRSTDSCVQPARYHRRSPGSRCRDSAVRRCKLRATLLLRDGGVVAVGDGGQLVCVEVE